MERKGGRSCASGSKQLQDARPLNHAYHRSLQVNAMEFRDRVHEAIKQAADQRHGQLVRFGKTGIDHELQDFSKRDKNDGRMVRVLCGTVIGYDRQDCLC